MRVSKGKTALHVLKYALLCGLMTGSSAIFLLFLQSIILIHPQDPLDREFYTGYCFFVPMVATFLGCMVGTILALLINSRRKLLTYISISALVIGMVASLIGLNSLLIWKGI